ncbi:MAG: hypothetical protein N2712_07000 [Brevinematales bacterium]|nr:hypothetical protein [Brevinematales bacterium]
MVHLIIVIICSIIQKNLFPIEINKIKVLGNTHTKEETILSIASEFRSGKEFPEAELENIANRVEERLRRTTWFYSSKVYVVESSKGKEYRNIVIEVDEGFLLRFSGGYAYGMFGIDNIWGSGEKLLLYLGYNKQGIEFEVDNLLERFFLKSRIGNFNSFYYSSHTKKVETQFVGAEVDAGYKFNWDTSFSILGGYALVFSDKYEFLFNHYYSGVRFEVDTRDDVFSANKGYYFALATKILRFEEPTFGVDFRAFVSIFDDLRIGIRGVVEGGRKLSQEYRFNVIGIDGVRGIPVESMVGNLKTLMNLELRKNLVDTSILGFLNLKFEGVGFVDVGRCFNSLEEVINLLEFDYPTAFGLGLRLYFLEPVFLPIRLEIGVDKKMNYNILFSVSEPF